MAKKNKIIFILSLLLMIIGYWAPESRANDDPNAYAVREMQNLLVFAFLFLSFAIPAITAKYYILKAIHKASFLRNISYSIMMNFVSAVFGMVLFGMLSMLPVMIGLIGCRDGDAWLLVALGLDIVLVSICETFLANGMTKSDVKWFDTVSLILVNGGVVVFGLFTSYHFIDYIRTL